jgi:hypothetical protein
MGERPRRRGAETRAWTYLALFDDGRAETAAETSVRGRAGRSAEEPSDDSDTEPR